MIYWFIRTNPLSLYVLFWIYVYSLTLFFFEKSIKTCFNKALNVY